MIDSVRTEADWNALISEAIETADPVLSNLRITRVHYLLSCALQEVIGPDAGANFHTWAVWGSRKAGITIRQEDRDQASRDATIVAGIVGGLVGVGVGWFFAWLASWSLAWSIVSWVLSGVAVGGASGYLLAGYTRTEASRLILEGNRIVLDDIGRATARYLACVSRVNNSALDDFLAGFRKGPTEQGGQDLLRTAFEQYEKSRRSSEAKVRHESNYFANCLAVLHEHIRLQPYISRSLPFLIRRCVTERLMTYSVGQQMLSVHEDVPPLSDVSFPPTLTSLDSAELREFLEGHQGWDRGRGSLANTRAKDWTRIRERMGYIVNLFRTRHLQPDLAMSPYSGEQMEQIAAGEFPSRPW